MTVIIEWLAKKQVRINDAFPLFYYEEGDHISAHHSYRAPGARVLSLAVRVNFSDDHQDYRIAVSKGSGMGGDWSDLLDVDLPHGETFIFRDDITAAIIDEHVGVYIERVARKAPRRDRVEWRQKRPSKSRFNRVTVQMELELLELGLVGWDDDPFDLGRAMGASL